MAQFGKQESEPIAICAGGVPPGFQGDVLKVHFSKEFLQIRMKLYQTPNIPIGGVSLDLGEKLSRGLLGEEFKVFVVDIVGEDEEVGRKGGYHGQFAMMMRLVGDLTRNAAQKSPVREMVERRTVKAKKIAKQEVGRLGKGEEKGEGEGEGEAKEEGEGWEDVREMVKDGRIPDDKVTKSYTVSVAVGEEKRKKLSWEGPGVSGTFKIISTCPEIIVPLLPEVRVGLGEDKAGVIRLLMCKSNMAMKTQVGIVIVRKEDGMIMECLKFTVVYEEK